MSKRDLTILGTSSQQPTRTRNHGGYFLFWNGEGLLFDPGEGCQRQYIFAGVAPPMTTRIFISHFHGDHCLGLGSMLMRLNLDNVTHPIHCYYPESGKKYFDRLRYGTIYHERIEVIEHPISCEGVIHEDDTFSISVSYLDHGVENLAYRVEEKEEKKYDKEKLKRLGIAGKNIKTLTEKGKVKINGNEVLEEDVSYIRKGDVFVYISDTKDHPNLEKIAKNATMLLCESTYLDSEVDLARKHSHLTAHQAATIAKNAKVETLILTHFSARYLDLTLFTDEARKVFGNTYVAKDLKKFPFPKTFHKKA